MHDQTCEPGGQGWRMCVHLNLQLQNAAQTTSKPSSCLMSCCQEGPHLLLAVLCDPDSALLAISGAAARVGKVGGSEHNVMPQHTLRIGLARVNQNGACGRIAHRQSWQEEDRAPWCPEHPNLAGRPSPQHAQMRLGPVMAADVVRNRACESKRAIPGPAHAGGWGCGGGGSPWVGALWQRWAAGAKRSRKVQPRDGA